MPGKHHGSGGKRISGRPAGPDAQPGRSLRPILPAASTSASVVSGIGRPGLDSRPLPPRRGKVDTACQPCRKRRAKCNGARPRCHECSDRGFECLYADSNTSKALKRKLSEVQDRLKEHEELYSTIQNRREDEALDIVRRIRSGHDAGSILRFVRDGDLLMQLSLAPETWYRYSFPYLKEMPACLYQYTNPYLKSILFEGVAETPPQRSHSRGESRDIETQYQVPYHAAKVIDPRIDSAKVSKWTLVTDNDALLRDLLQSYFLHQYSMFPFFHKDHFLDDLVAGRRRFCSSLLVNAVLAAACQGYIKGSRRPEFWNPETLQYQFATEARRLREIDIETKTLPTIQAWLVMSLACSMNGVDKVSLSYTVQTVALANAMELFDPLSDNVSRRMRDVWAHTAWAVFGWQATVCFHYLRPPLVPDAPRHLLPDPEDESAWYPELYLLYPGTQNLVSVRLGEHFRALSELRTLENEITRATFVAPNTDRRLTLDEAQKFHQRLVTWYRNLGGSLTVRKAVQPFQLVIHMHYYNVVIHLLEPFVRVVTSPAEAGEGGAELEVRTCSPEAAVIDAKVRLETILRLYYLRHGFEHYDPMMHQFYILMGFISIRALWNASKLPPNIVSGLRSTLALCIRGLGDLATHSYLACRTFRMLRDYMDDESVRLLNQVDIGEVEDETEASIVHHVESQSPINIVSIAENSRSHKVESLIAAYKELGLSGHT